MESEPVLENEELLVVADLDGRVLSLHGGLLEWARWEGTGFDFIERCIAAHDRGAARERLTTLGTGAPIRFTCDVERWGAERQHRTLRWSAWRVDGPSGHLIVGRAEDITLPVELLNDTAASELVFAQTLANTTDLLVVVRPDGTVAFTNRRARTAGLVRGGRPEWPGEVRAQIAQLLPKVLASGHEEKVLAPTGRGTALRAVLVPFDYDGLTCVEVAIAEVPPPPEELERNRHLQQLGLMTAACSHDANNFLVVARLAVDALEDRVVDDGPELLNELRGALTRLEQLHKRVLQGARVGPGQKLELDGYLDGSERTFRRLVGGHPLELKTSGALGSVKLSPLDLDQILANLLVNARDASTTGTPITVEARGEQGRVVLSVADRGHGISSEALPRVFEPLFTTRKEGTGLGLAIVKQLVESAGGDVCVESREGEGTRVIVRLPNAS